MSKLYYLLIIIVFLIHSGCKSDNPVTPPSTGEVLLAEVSGDSVGVQSGSADKIQSITSQQLNFKDKDSARISFYFTGENNTSTDPMIIYFSVGPRDSIIYHGANLNILPTEQFANITIPSPRVNQFFLYKISTTSSGFSYFKFRDLKIYKK